VSLSNVSKDVRSRVVELERVQSRACSDAAIRAARVRGRTRGRALFRPCPPGGRVLQVSQQCRLLCRWARMLVFMSTGRGMRASRVVHTAGTGADHQTGHSSSRVHNRSVDDARVSDARNATTMRSARRVARARRSVRGHMVERRSNRLGHRESGVARARSVHPNPAGRTRRAMPS